MKTAPAKSGTGASEGIRSTTHTCPIGVVHPNTPVCPIVDKAWCFDSWAERVANLRQNLPESRWPPPGWTLHRDGAVEVAYAPVDWTNKNARVVLVGITPGRHQGWLATKEAGAALRQGASYEQALRRADQVGAFSGPMRNNLVQMLDQIGVASRLRIDTCGDLFGSAHHLATHVSALPYPVFVRKANFGGAQITRHPVFVALIRQVLAGQLKQANNALVIPLGAAAGAAVQLLVQDGVVESDRCLLGFPHPSGANGHRKKQFKARRKALSRAVANWESPVGLRWASARGGPR